MGILLASYIGISKTMYCDKDNIMDLTPVDVCVKAMIIATWKRAHDPIRYQMKSQNYTVTYDLLFSELFSG